MKLAAPLKQARTFSPQAYSTKVERERRLRWYAVCRCCLVMMCCLKPVARRVGVFTGAERRRWWSVVTKTRIVAESYATQVGEVADQYGLSET